MKALEKLESLKGAVSYNGHGPNGGPETAFRGSWEDVKELVESALKEGKATVPSQPKEAPKGIKPSITKGAKVALDQSADKPTEVAPAVDTATETKDAAE